MDWLQFVSTLAASLAWPLTVLAIVILLRKPILGAILKIRAVKYGDLHIDLSEELKAVEENIAAQPSEPDSPHQPPPAPTSEDVRIAEVSPRAAMILAWQKVEAALSKAVVRHGLAFGHGKASAPHYKLLALKNLGLVDDLTLLTFKKLWNLRNNLAHSHGPSEDNMDVTLEDALSMTKSCDWLVEKLNSL